MRALRAIRLVAAGLSLLAMASCQDSSGPRSAYEPLSEDRRDPAAAQKLALEAADLLASDPAKAESLLREALADDLYCGSAHNNLGVIYLKQSKLYEAANEFEWSRKLMPGHPDPRVNLALTLEHAGKTDDALATYRTALEIYPDYLPALEGLASLQLRTAKPDASTHHALEEISLRASTSTWGAWAREQLTRQRP